MKLQLIKQTVRYMCYRSGTDTHLLRDRDSGLTIPISAQEAKTFRNRDKKTFEERCDFLFERAELVSGSMSLILTEAQADNQY